MEWVESEATGSLVNMLIHTTNVTMLYNILKTGQNAATAGEIGLISEYHTTQICQMNHNDIN